MREGVVVICDCLVRECQHILEKEKLEEKTTFYSFYIGEQFVTCVLIRVMCGEVPPVDTGNLW